MKKTATLPLTYACKRCQFMPALCCSGFSVLTTSLPLFTTAEEALKKAKEVDTKGEYKQMIR
jgi:hypothetical protein